MFMNILDLIYIISKQLKNIKFINNCEVVNFNLKKKIRIVNIMKIMV